MIIDPRQEMKHIGRGDSFKNALTEFHRREIKDPVFVEIGTTRGANGGGPMGDGWATNAWAWYVDKYGGHLHTVDLDPSCIEQCKNITIPFVESIDYHIMTGVEFIESFPQGKLIDFLYLDGSDDPQEMVDEFQAAIDGGHLGLRSLILLDDIPPEYLKAGKGSQVIPMILDEGYEMLYHDTTPRVMQMLFGLKDWNIKWGI